MFSSTNQGCHMNNRNTWGSRQKWSEKWYLNTKLKLSWHFEFYRYHHNQFIISYNYIFHSLKFHLDSGRKLKVQRIFQLLAGGPLNVSCTFNLRHCKKTMKFAIKDFFSKCGQIRSFLRIWSHLPKKSLLQTSFFVQCILCPGS